MCAEVPDKEDLPVYDLDLVPLKPAPMSGPREELVTRAPASKVPVPLPANLLQQAAFWISVYRSSS